MSVSLYYTARRLQSITLQEQEACEKIAKHYETQYPYGELYEGFCIYDPEEPKDESEKDVIFSGATKLPPDVDEELFFDIVDWWLGCLSEITDALSGAQWHVHIDDVDIEWGED